MTPEIFSEWLRRQGQHVIRTDSSYWRSEGYHVYQAFPEHWLIQPPERELRELMLRHHALALRYSTAPRGDETDGYHVVHTAARYDLDVLGAWARKNVRRGLRSCDIHPISLERYIEEGWALRVDTLARQQRTLGESREDWRRKSSAAAGLEGFEVWAAEVEHKLAATLLFFQMDGWGYMVYQQCHRDYLREHVNNALSFVVTQNLIQKGNIRGIYYGMRSLDAPASVDEFKFRMGYVAKPVRQRVLFHPYMAPLVNRYTHRALRVVATASPGSRLLGKADGMLRLYLADTAPALEEGLTCSPPRASKL